MGVLIHEADTLIGIASEAHVDGPLKDQLFHGVGWSVNQLFIVVDEALVLWEVIPVIGLAEQVELLLEALLVGEVVHGDLWGASVDVVVVPERLDTRCRRDEDMGERHHTRCYGREAKERRRSRPLWSRRRTLTGGRCRSRPAAVGGVTSH